MSIFATEFLSQFVGMPTDLSPQHSVRDILEYRVATRYGKSHESVLSPAGGCGDLCHRLCSANACRYPALAISAAQNPGESARNCAGLQFAFPAGPSVQVSALCRIRTMDGLYPDPAQRYTRPMTGQFVGAAVALLKADDMQ